MIGRFIRFYPAYTAEMVLAMPWPRFWVLSEQIGPLQATEHLAALTLAATAAHPGENGELYRDLVEQLEEAAEPTGGSTPPVRALAPEAQITVGLPGVVFEAEPGSIMAERARQKAAWERRLAEAAGRPADAPQG